MSASSDDDVPLSQLNRKPVGQKLKRNATSDRDEEDKILAVKRKKTERRPREAVKGGKRTKAKELTRMQRLEQGIAAFEWWNATDPPEGKAWKTLEHCGMTFEPQYEPHGVDMLYDGESVVLTPYQEELATFYAAMPADGPQLNVSRGLAFTYLFEGLII